jgi:hypothetical protein
MQQPITEPTQQSKEQVQVEDVTGQQIPMQKKKKMHTKK